ncbi:hypothetical protein [Salicibibacter kimchii]|uniref:Uncharacterized protein n=1 Tax=Salicibibacter kimchii TaxID=2099786 RepID=A0A345BWJ1_9BACI|nr:hypothetical protein [Salicibibacter kimchii]AXF55322.1 hypothetical protein DT065_04315 [Salicibibacter kimchii]
MNGTLNATDVRKHWGQFNDDIVRDGPRFVKRNRDTWAALSTDHLKVAFEKFTFEAAFNVEKDGSFTVSLKDFDLIENGDTKDDAVDLLANELIEYAHDYQNNFQKYFNAPNRRHHFPYIMNVLVQEDSEGVKGLIQCPVGEK